MAILRASNNTLSNITALPFATGGFVKLLSLTGGTTSQSSYDVDSTYINSTYDNYKIIAGYTHPTDNKYVYINLICGLFY